MWNELFYEPSADGSNEAESFNFENPAGETPRDFSLDVPVPEEEFSDDEDSDYVHDNHDDDLNNIHRPHDEDPDPDTDPDDEPFHMNFRHPRRRNNTRVLSPDLQVMINDAESPELNSNTIGVANLMRRVAQADSSPENSVLHMSSREEEVSMTSGEEQLPTTSRNAERQVSAAVPRIREQMYNASRFLNIQPAYGVRRQGVFQINSVENQRLQDEHRSQDDLILTAEDERRCQNIVEPSCVFRTHVSE